MTGRVVSPPESQPTVSVIIATYNKSAALQCAMESVLWQTFTDWELWVVGDCCTDDSADVVASYTDPRIHWYNLPRNSGYQSAPSNEGLRRAAGAYVAYLNHDDLWLPNHLQALVDRLEATDADLVYSVLAFVGPHGAWGAEAPTYPYAPRPPHASAVLHRRDIVDEIGYWPAPAEVAQFPRVAYFRRAEMAGKRFAFASYLTVLMFTGTKAHTYRGIGWQPEYLARIRQDPDLPQRELAGLLASAQYRLDRPPRPRELVRQMNQAAGRSLLKRGIDPARLRFWARPGTRVRAWRKGHGLD
jgi:glycosyltransferase involved in cell wall biosynthesis